MDEIEKNIVLIGMMGAGKTFIGGKLAKILAHFSYVDIDEKIEKEQGICVAEIFEKHSESYFRELESKMIKKYAAKTNQIISTGGGAMQNLENLSVLKENGVVFYLKASAKELFERLNNASKAQEVETRPLLKDAFSLQTIQDILKRREKNYMKADFVIDTEQKRAYTILDDIIKEYDKYVK